MRAVYIRVAPKVDTDSCLVANEGFIARRAKLNEIISNNGTNSDGVETKIGSTQPQHLNLEEYRMGWSEIVRMQYIYAVLGNKLFSRYSFNYDVYCRADIERKTVDSSHFRR